METINVMKVKASILSKAEAGDEAIINAIGSLRDYLSFLNVSEFTRSVCWTIIRGWQRSGEIRISDKQATVIANELAKLGLSALESCLSARELLAFELTTYDAVEEDLAAEKAYQDKQKANIALRIYEVEIKSGRSFLYKNTRMTAEEAAEVIKTYLAGDKSLKARVKKDGELIDYQPLLVANAKEAGIN